MPKPMSRPDREAFLREPRPAILSIPQEGRGPLSSPVWFDFEPGGDFWIVMQGDSRKGRLMQVGTHVSLCAQQEARPYKYVTVEGPVVSVERYGADTLQAMATRYLGAEGGKAYVEAMRDSLARGKGIKVTFRPNAWLSADYG